MFMKPLIFAGAALAVLAAPIAQAETRVTYKSAKSTSSYYQMAVQLAEAVKRGSNGGNDPDRRRKSGLGAER